MSSLVGGFGILLEQFLETGVLVGGGLVLISISLGITLGVTSGHDFLGGAGLENTGGGNVEKACSAVLLISSLGATISETNILSDFVAAISGTIDLLSEILDSKSGLRAADTTVSHWVAPDLLVLLALGSPECSTLSMTSLRPLNVTLVWVNSGALVISTELIGLILGILTGGVTCGELIGLEL
jgi:hypothetical protein